MSKNVIVSGSLQQQVSDCMCVILSKNGCYAVRAFYMHGLGSPSERRATTSYPDKPYLYLKHFHHDGGGLFQDDNTFIHGAWEVTIAFISIKIMM